MLEADASSTGISVAEGQSIVIDLGGNVLTFEGEMAGSPGTKTLGMQLLKGSHVTIKGGTIRSADAKMLIQNYSNLTLDGVTLEGSEKNGYVLSNNFGTTIIKNGTKILPTEGNIAFDAYYGMFAQYDAGVSVIIEDSTVVVDGPIEFGKANRAKDEQFAANAHIYIPEGYTGVVAPAGYEFTAATNKPGYLELVKSST